MKTNQIARLLAKIRPRLTLLALLGLVGFEVWLGASTVARLGQTTGLQLDGFQVPDLNLGAAIDAAR